MSASDFSLEQTVPPHCLNLKKKKKMKTKGSSGAGIWGLLTVP